VLVPVVIAVSDAEMHRSHFAMRALETRSRPRDRYLGNFEKIRALQSYILSLAERAGAPVVEMFDLDATLQQIAAIVVAKALERAQVRTEVEPLPEGVGDGWPTGPMEPTGTGGAMASGREGSIVAKPRTPGRVPRLKSWELLGARRKG
jgi:hypothetical protein